MNICRQPKECQRLFASSNGEFCFRSESEDADAHRANVRWSACPDLCVPGFPTALACRQGRRRRCPGPSFLGDSVSAHGVNGIGVGESLCGARGAGVRGERSSDSELFRFGYGGEEFLVALGLYHAFEDSLGCFGRVRRVRRDDRDHPPEEPHLPENRLGQ